MALKIRLRQQGRNNRATYRVVVTDVRSPRDGKYLEALGWYSPLAPEDQQLLIKTDRVQHWLDTGAQLTDSVETLVSRVDPTLVRKQTEKVLAAREKVRVKRKARKKAAA
ncbi:MAG: 30S ribosomal protein S16 [Parachlamydiaceae bacterium]|nr:30S ribosomal protein S16 [Parachlamydiaceae bacterium]